jgi:hypothetical protein
VDGVDDTKASSKVEMFVRIAETAARINSTNPRVISSDLDAGSSKDQILEYAINLLNMISVECNEYGGNLQRQLGAIDSLKEEMPDKTLDEARRDIAQAGNQADFNKALNGWQMLTQYAMSTQFRSNMTEYSNRVSVLASVALSNLEKVKHAQVT